MTDLMMRSYGRKTIELGKMPVRSAPDQMNKMSAVSPLRKRSNHDALGRGQTVLKGSACYPMFGDDGSIVAPALFHEIAPGDEAAGRRQVSATTFDLYCAPMPRHPKYFTTRDPALVYD